MEVTELIDEYNDATFESDAVGEMAATFDNRQAMMVAAGTADEGQTQQASLELFNEWKRICERHGVESEGQRKALVLQGMAQYIDDSKQKNIASMAVHLADM